MTVSTVVDTKNAEIATKNVQVALTVNCRVQHLDLDPRTSLLDALREHLRLTGTKKGWDHGQCGACTVLINGRRINSCLTLAVMLAPDLVERRAGVLERVEFVEDHFGLLQHRADGVEIRRMHVGAHGGDRRALPGREVFGQQRRGRRLAAVLAQAHHFAMHDKCGEQVARTDASGTELELTF